LSESAAFASAVWRAFSVSAAFASAAQSGSVSVVSPRQSRLSGFFSVGGVRFSGLSCFLGLSSFRFDRLSDFVRVGGYLISLCFGGLPQLLRFGEGGSRLRGVRFYRGIYRPARKERSKCAAKNGGE
jgi:hypothetical protein